MIKICNMNPSIVENTDRWGAPDGTFYVDKFIGYVDDEWWQKIDLHQNWFKVSFPDLDPKTKGKDALPMLDKIKNSMTRYAEECSYAFSPYLQFDAWEDETILTYMNKIRYMVVWNEPSVQIWTQEWQDKVNALEAELRESRFKGMWI